MFFFRRLDILSLQQFIGSTLKVFIFRVGIVALFGWFLLILLDWFINRLRRLPSIPVFA